MKVNIYLETDKKSQIRTERKYGYVIETTYRGELLTRNGFGKIEGTYHQANLQALMDSLERFNGKCEVEIHTKDTFVAARTLRISEFAASGFLDTKGNPIKNANQWKDLHKKITKCGITITTKAGKHTYSQWMLEQMKEKED